MKVAPIFLAVAALFVLAACGTDAIEATRAVVTATTVEVNSTTSTTPTTTEVTTAPTVERTPTMLDRGKVSHADCDGMIDTGNVSVFIPDNWDEWCRGVLVSTEVLAEFPSDRVDGICGDFWGMSDTELIDYMMDSDPIENRDQAIGMIDVFWTTCEGRRTTEPTSEVLVTTTTTEAATTTTMSPASLRGVENLLMVVGFENNDAEWAGIRQSLASVLTDDLNWDRVNVISGSVTDEFGMVLVIDATHCDGCSDDYNQSAHIEAVNLFAKGLWGSDMFGPVTDDRSTNGALGFWFTADGVAYTMSAQQMIDVNSFTLSAQQAMGL